MDLREGTRSADKHRAILQAATEIFLERGYAGASMDEVAARAAVGKQTVYKHFADKRSLFTEIVLGTTDQVDGMVQLVAETLSRTDQVERDLTTLARRLLLALMDPQLLRLRRLIIASAGQFPELGRAWYQKGFERVLASLADSFTRLEERGLMNAREPGRAADQFVGMLLWIPLNKAMFLGEDEPCTEAELEAHADGAVQAFMAAHGRLSPVGPAT